jgi:hypothetical protein
MSLRHAFWIAEQRLQVAKRPATNSIGWWAARKRVG